ncbi:MAG: penicillin acylase family protein [Gammaproteobacteria bacterium]|nr:penicillin acylase family protein [Gammaproteobacteria bacterium]
MVLGLGLSWHLALAAELGSAAQEQARWRREAARVEITRDDWGIAHVHGQSDADAVFGMVYAQAEDDFKRIESNYLTALGRSAEAEGPEALAADLRQRLFIDPAQLQAEYRDSPAWLVALMDSWADGLNYFLATHTQLHPRVLHRFEPWMALAFTEGSIGGDIERAVDLRALAAFYRVEPQQARGSTVPWSRDRAGSNGIAIAPANTRDGHALLLINPHTTFFFRSELHMSSDAGLDAYGAATWGQFFIYQGFNPHIGWMHTSTGADNVDQFAETVVERGNRIYYRYGRELRPMQTKTIELRYRMEGGVLGVRSFRTFATHHGPITRRQGDRWISIALMNKPVPALEQSFLRTKAYDLGSYRQVARLQANSSNNTVFADSKGEIAMLLPQFMPRRDDRFDYTRPVDGSDPATDWRGLHTPESLPDSVNPAHGWVFNSNDGPYTNAGPDSPRREDYPRYMDTAGENPRGEHATQLLSGRKDFTLESLTSAAFDSYLPYFARLIPPVLEAFDALPPEHPLRDRLHEQIELLRHWDYRWSDHSLATSLAVIWGDSLWDALVRPEHQDESHGAWDDIVDSDPMQKLVKLTAASDLLTREFGNWRVPWGEINRFQRLSGDIAPRFSDAAPSTPVPFTSSRWGSLASFGAKAYPGTRRYYGTDGNSFVAVVEFGPKVRARAVTAGGESGDPASPHFNDEAIRYARGQLRPVYFYPEELLGHVERSYHPGQ